jgi:hypothetical protein
MMAACGAAVVTACALVAAEGISAHVVTIDHQKQCLTVEWDNDTEKRVCWNDKTKFSDLDSGRAARATDVRKGSYLRMEGTEKAGVYWATEIAIWEAASRPAD